LKSPPRADTLVAGVATRLFTLLVLLTLLPAAFVLWFMNEALTADTASAHQRELEAYRGQLRLVRARLDPLWRAHAARLEGPGTPEEQFQRLTAGEIAEGAVLLDDNGALLYPDRESAAPDPAIDEAQRVEALAARLNDYSRPLPAAMASASAGSPGGDATNRTPAVST
jgi:hypothetical protein